MKYLMGALVLIAAISAPPVLAQGHEEGAAQAESSDQAVQPDTPSPSEPPPPPPTALPDAPFADPQLLTQRDPAETGQWVHTAQYGWVWMPYGDTYTHVPSDDTAPSMYVYYPDAGWCWVLAPWLWGLGPMPYFGLLGHGYFGWYGRGLGHWYGFARAYGNWGWNGRAYWNAGRWHGVNRFASGAGRGPQGSGRFRGAGSLRSGFRSGGEVRGAGSFRNGSFRNNDSSRNDSGPRSGSAIRGGSSSHGNGGFHSARFGGHR